MVLTPKEDLEINVETFLIVTKTGGCDQWTESETSGAKHSSRHRVLPQTTIVFYWEMAAMAFR